MTQMLNRQPASAPWTIHDSPNVEPVVPGAPITRGEWEAVTRRVSCGTDALQDLPDRFELSARSVIPLGALGAFTLDSAFAPALAAGVAGWTASGRLRGRGPWYSRVDVEIWPWSADAMELRVAPRSRRVARWDERSRRRYFAQAHAAADALVRMLAPGAAAG